MESAGTLLEGMASLAWPFVVLFVFVRFGPAILLFIESLKSRGLTIKVGDRELAVAEAATQQRTISSDLQNQMVFVQSALRTLAKALSELGSATVTDDNIALSVEPKAVEEERLSILWVDDNTAKHSYELAHLRGLGIKVTTAVSTEEALSLFRSAKYHRCVICDMVRIEKGQHHYKAGIELVRVIRSLDTTIPIIIYSGEDETAEFRKEAVKAGANAMTASPTTVLRFLDQPEAWPAATPPG